MINDDERLVLNVEEARKILGLSRSSMYEGIRRHEIPAIKIGRRILIPRYQLKKMLEGSPLPQGDHNSEDKVKEF